MLPDGSGKDLCNEIKNSSHSSVPVILMSARIDKMKNFCNPGDFLTKPVNLYNLVDYINNLIQNNHADELGSVHHVN